jgi:hypothetical protein
MKADNDQSNRWHCQQICQQLLGKRAKSGLAELWILVLSTVKIPLKILKI